jgi:hypothetical protein
MYQKRYSLFGKRVYKIQQIERNEVLLIHYLSFKTSMAEHKEYYDENKKLSNSLLAPETNVFQHIFYKQKAGRQLKVLVEIMINNSKGNINKSTPLLFWLKLHSHKVQFTFRPTAYNITIHIK